MKVWHVGEGNIFFYIMKKYCQFAYGNADILAVTSRPFIKYMIDMNKVDEKKIVHIPNHYEQIVNEDDGNIKDNSINKDTVDFLLAGNIGQQQNVECLLHAVKLVKTQKNYHIHIYGDGTSYLDCKQLVQKLDIQDRVTFYGRVSKKVLNSIYPRMDAFILTLCSVEQIGYTANTVPGRLQGYMTVGKPIIASIDGGGSEIINEVGCGIAVPANDVKALAGALVEFIEHKEKYNECGLRAQHYFKENFEKNVVMDKFEYYLKKLAFS